MCLTCVWTFLSKSSITSAAGCAGLGEKLFGSLPPPPPGLFSCVPSHLLSLPPLSSTPFGTTHTHYPCVNRTERTESGPTHTHTLAAIGRQCRGHVARPSPNGRWSPPPVICSSPHRLSTRTSTRHQPATRPAAKKEEERQRVKSERRQDIRVSSVRPLPPNITIE
jgi:hypothetical protein